MREKAYGKEEHTHIVERSNRYQFSLLPLVKIRYPEFFSEDCVVRNFIFYFFQFDRKIKSVNCFFFLSHWFSLIYGIESRNLQIFFLFYLGIWTLFFFSLLGQIRNFMSQRKERIILDRNYLAKVVYL